MTLTSRMSLTPACMPLPAKGRSVVLTRNIVMETAQAFGGPT
jgi:hypothetical protein